MIKKPNTSGLKHRTSTFIRHIQLMDDGNPKISYTTAAGELADANATGGSFELLANITPRAWARAEKGEGVVNPDLRHGLRKQSRYTFSLFFEPKDKKSKSKEETVTGIHTYPDDNYVHADFSAALGRPVAKEHAIVQFVSATIADENGDLANAFTGEMDIVAFPADLRRDRAAFLTALEKLEEIKHSTVVETSSVRYTVQTIAGQEVVFTCRKINKR